MSCELCHERPAADHDVFCALCRQDVEDRSDLITDPVELVLSEHGRMGPLSSMDRTMCNCGESFAGGPGLHRRHLAERIYEALGLPGPSPWDFGEKSESRSRFDSRGRLIPDES